MQLENRILRRTIYFYVKKVIITKVAIILITHIAYWYVCAQLVLVLAEPILYRCGQLNNKLLSIESSCL